MPSSVHEIFAIAFIRSQAFTTQDLRSETENQCSVVGTQKVSSFTGAYKDSKKKSDVLFKYKRQDRLVTYIVVVEIDFSKSYEEFVDDVKI